MLNNSFFNRKACVVAKALLGKVIRVKYQSHWLSAQIIETESYYLIDKASHASLGWTQKRNALFMPAGTIYMYYARGAPSFNISCKGAGNAVLIKSAIPYLEDDPHILEIMQALNPHKITQQPRSFATLCKGQTLLCKSLGLTVAAWDQQQFDEQRFFIEDVGYVPRKIIQTIRLGISQGRDEHLPYRYIDAQYLKYCTKQPV